VQRRVAEFSKVCSYDRAGFGYSDDGPGPRTSGRIAEELGSLLDSAHIEGPVILVGAWFGGFSTRILASTQPDRVHDIVGEAPDLVIEAIRSIVERVRAKEGTPAC
jgi:pimeloyl-ACP methyl ester carboxylesterase